MSVATAPQLASTPEAPLFPAASPSSFDTDRLTLRRPRAEDAQAVNEAVLQSFDALHRWMPWAATRPTLRDTRAFLERAEQEFDQRKTLYLLVFLRGTSTLIGSSGFHAIDWAVPRLEIGYWLRAGFTGRGYMTEAVRGQVDFATTVLGARRIEIRMDDKNVHSWRVAERVGFKLDGVLRCYGRDRNGELRDTRIYSRVF